MNMLWVFDSAPCPNSNGRVRMGPQMSTVALLHGQGSLRAIVLRLALVTSRIAYLQVAQQVLLNPVQNLWLVYSIFTLQCPACIYHHLPFTFVYFISFTWLSFATRYPIIHPAPCNADQYPQCLRDTSLVLCCGSSLPFRRENRGKFREVEIDDQPFELGVSCFQPNPSRYIYNIYIYYSIGFYPLASTFVILCSFQSWQLRAGPSWQVTSHQS